MKTPEAASLKEETQRDIGEKKTSRELSNVHPCVPKKPVCRKKYIV